jgi:hypothetical protein
MAWPHGLSLEQAACHRIGPTSPPTPAVGVFNRAEPSQLTVRSTMIRIESS